MIKHGSHVVYRLDMGAKSSGSSLLCARNSRSVVGDVLSENTKCVVFEG